MNSNILKYVDPFKALRRNWQKFTVAAQTILVHFARQYLDPCGACSNSPGQVHFRPFDYGWWLHGLLWWNWADLSEIVSMVKGRLRGGECNKDCGETFQVSSVGWRRFIGIPVWRLHYTEYHCKVDKNYLGPSDKQERKRFNFINCLEKNCRTILKLTQRKLTNFYTNMITD